MLAFSWHGPALAQLLFLEYAYVGAAIVSPTIAVMKA